jgi:Holliday junction resolvase RusA-like endonuclease
VSTATIRRVIVPSVPPVILSPNRKNGQSWQPIYRARKAVHREWCAEIKAQQVEPVTPGAQVRVTIRYLWPGRRSVMDHDNAVGLSKYILDSFTIAEIWSDDSQVVGVEIEQQKLDKTGRTVYRNGCTVVDIEEVSNG